MNLLIDILSTIWYNKSMVGNRLREVLKREGVSAYRLWKDLQIDRGQLSRFFHGKQNISLTKLEQIADYLGYDIEFVKRKRSRKGG
jgi:transcriptional regulator with XRE-family HTH domain